MSRKLTTAAVGLVLLCCFALRLPAAADEATTPPAPTHGAPNRPCADAVQKYCAEVTPGKGAILNCLQPHMAEVSEPCRRTMERIAKRRTMIQERQRRARTMRQGMHTPAAAAAVATPAK